VQEFSTGFQIIYMDVRCAAIPEDGRTRIHALSKKLNLLRVLKVQGNSAEELLGCRRDHGYLKES